MLRRNFLFACGSRRPAIISTRGAQIVAKLTPIHDEVPDTSIYSIDGCERNEHGHERRVWRHSIQTQAHVVQYGEHVFATVDEMRERITRVIVPSETLQCSPYGREACEESEQPRMRRVAV